MENSLSDPINSSATHNHYSYIVQFFFSPSAPSFSSFFFYMGVSVCRHMEWLWIGRDWLKSSTAFTVIFYYSVFQSNSTSSIVNLFIHGCLHLNWVQDLGHHISPVSVLFAICPTSFSSADVTNLLFIPFLTWLYKIRYSNSFRIIHQLFWTVEEWSKHWIDQGTGWREKWPLHVRMDKVRKTLSDTFTAVLVCLY